MRRELADGETDRGRMLGEMLDLTIYRESPARHPIIGYLEVLNRTTNQTIIDFYHERYVPNNQVFVVVGDVKPQEVLDKVARQWAGTARSYDTVVPMPGEPEQVSAARGPSRDGWCDVRHRSGVADGQAIRSRSVCLGSGGLYSRRGRELAVGATIEIRPASGPLGSCRQQHALVCARLVQHSPHQPETWKTAVDEILREVYRLRDEPVSTAAAKAKKQKAAELIFDNQTVQHAADALGRSMLSADDPQFDGRYVEEIQKVSAAQIQDVARRYFTPQRLNRVVIAPPGGLPKEKSLAAGAEEGKVRLVKLENGLRVLVKRHPNLPLVNIQAYVLRPDAGRDAPNGRTLVPGSRHAG